MKKTKILNILFINICTFLAIFCIFKPVSAQVVLEPRFIQINQIGSEIVLEGEFVSNTEVLLYIDGIFFELIQKQDNNKLNFKFSPPKEFIEIMLISRDKTSLVLSAPYIQNYRLNQDEANNPPPTPTIISPNTDKITSNQKELITGLSKTDTQVHFYIDGVYNGKTDLLSDESGTANFAYEPFQALAFGQHYIQVVAENLTGEKSTLSDKIYFNLEPPLPAPTLLTIETDTGNISVSGLAKNNSKIYLYKNNKLLSSFIVENHPSGVSGFSYSFQNPTNNLEIFAIAEDARGKISSQSNILKYKTEPKSPKITPVAAIEKNDEQPVVLSDYYQFEKTGQQSNINSEKEKTKQTFLNKLQNLIFSAFLTVLSQIFF